MKLSFTKVYTVGSKNDPETPRVWLQSLVCNKAGFEKGQDLYVNINEEQKEITISNSKHINPDATVKVSGRKDDRGEIQPLVDTAGKKYTKIIRVRQKVEICVYREGQKSKVVIRPLQYNLFEKETFINSADQRITFQAIYAGAGFGSAALENSGHFISNAAIELEDDSAEVFAHNFPNTYLFNGDVRDVGKIPLSDVSIVTLPCNEFSSLGHHESGVMTDLILATSEIIKASQSRIVFFENVPQWYNSTSYSLLKELLTPEYPYSKEETLNSFDFGTIMHRTRGFSVLFKNEADWMTFNFPSAPKSLRKKKLKDYMTKTDEINYEWKSLNTWMTNFKDRGEKGGSWKDRSLDKTFVTELSNELQCVPKRYTGQSASSSYVLSKDRESFRFLSINELFKIFRVPTWFKYPEWLGKIRQYEMIGQSLDCGLIQSIGNRIAEIFFKNKSVNCEDKIGLFDKQGQLGFTL